MAHAVADFVEEASQMHTRLIGCFLLIALTSGCTTEHRDVLQVMLGAGWIVYLLALFITRFLSRRKIQSSVIIRGLIIFGAVSVVLPLLVKEGRIDPFSAVLFGLFGAIFLIPPVLVYSVALLILLRILGLDLYFIIPYIVAGAYFFSLIIAMYGEPRAMILWNWMFLSIQ